MTATPLAFAASAPRPLRNTFKYAPIFHESAVRMELWLSGDMVNPGNIDP